MTEPLLRVKASGLRGSGYKIPTEIDPETGKPIVVPGVTTVTNIVHKPGVYQWGVDQTAAYAVANVDALLNRDETQGFGFLRWYSKRKPDLADPLRDYSRGVLDDLAELGTATHEFIEADLLGLFPPDITSPEMAEMVEQWLLFKSQHFIRTILVEATVYNPGAGYAGTLDLLIEIDGVVYLLDIKTARKTWPDHFMQLAALGAAHVLMIQVDEDTPGAVEYTPEGMKEPTYWLEDILPPFHEYAILHLRPTDIDKDGNTVAPFCHLETKATDQNFLDIDLYFEEFSGLLLAKRAEREVELRQRARAKEGQSVTK